MSAETGRLIAVLLKHPRQAWRGPETVRTRWRELNYAGEPDFDTAVREYETFVSLLSRFVPEVRFLPEDGRTGLDSIYTRDAGVATPGGLLLGRMGKAARRGEPGALGEYCAAAGIPVVGAIRPPGTLEGGDVAWLDGTTVAVGRGYRTNAAGLDQFRACVVPGGVEVIEVPLPHWNGPGDVFHLMSMVSPVGSGTLLVYARLLPVPFRESLVDRGFALLEVPEAEFDTLGGNVLALGGSRCLALAGNPLTKAVLERAGFEVAVFPGREISLKGGGGPTCLTQPLLREP